MLGFLALTTQTDYAPYLEALKDGLRQLGYVEGQNILIVYRFANGDADQLPGLANELVALDVDIILAAATQANQAALNVTHTIPIVMTNSGDPLGAGLVKSLAQPGGNLTGLTSLNRDLAGKRMELLKLAVPSLSRVGVIWNDTSRSDFLETQKTGQDMDISVVSLPIQTADDISDVLRMALDQRVDGLIPISTPMINGQRQTIAAFGLKHQLPLISEQREFVQAGGLLAYGANVVDLYRRAATLVDKILNGARPSELPVERAQQFDLLINLATARQLGLTFPDAILLQATEVVQ